MIPYPPPDDEIDGAAILSRVENTLRKYLSFPSQHAFVAVALWSAHTHATKGTWYVTPRLIFDSAEPGSGKTRALELLGCLVRKPEMTISATVAAIFRMLADDQYTLLFDEVDAIFNPKNGGNYEDLRALLNAGYKQGATIARCVGDAKAMKVERFTVFAPVALAGLAGRMPATITTRAITIHMRRRAPGEHVSPFRERDAEHEIEPVREALAEWVEGASSLLADARPKMPDGVTDRPSEVWESLLAIADQAGGEWPDRARAACTYFVLDSKPDELSLGVRLLSDLRAVFRAQGDPDRMATSSLLDRLRELDEAPWNDLYGKPLDARRLGRELARYGVESRNLKLPDGSVRKGYLTTGEDGLLDAWNRYLVSSATSATDATSQVSPVAAEIAVADVSATGSDAATAVSREVAGVADVAPESGSGIWRVSGERVRSA